jgi:membrane protein DedA with SNARE-associated domain
MLHHILQIWIDWVRDGGYWAVLVLMMMESSIIPVPSEIVIPPAAFLALKYGNMSFAGVIIAGVVGSYVGSALSYWVSLWIGRPVLARYGRFVLLGEDKIARAEVWLARYEAGGVFFARLLPVIRHLISIPAGIVRMNFALFSLMTTLGAALWCGVLAYLGRLAFQVEPGLLDQNDPAAWEHFIRAHSIWVVVGAVVLAVLYVLVLKLSGGNTAEKTA